MKKLALFPMTRDMCALARYPSLLRNYEFSNLFTENSFANDADISHIDGGTVTGTVLTEYTISKLTVCDVLFADYDEKVKNLSIYKEVIEDAKNMGKEVMLSRKLADKLQDTPLTWPKDAPYVAAEFDYLHEIRVPVITVLSQGSRTDQFAVELALRKYFTEKGYNVSQVGSHDACGLLGFPAMPDFMFEQRDAYDKTLKFNQYVHDLTEKEQPDLLIMGVPGATMKYNDKLLCGMGYLPFIVCGAVRSDLQILSLYHNAYNKVVLNEMEQHGFYRLGSPIRFFNIANVKFQPDFVALHPKEKYLELNSEYVTDSIKNTMETGNYRVFNILDSESAKVACTAVEDVLSGNVDSVM